MLKKIHFRCNSANIHCEKISIRNNLYYTTSTNKPNKKRATFSMEQFQNNNTILRKYVASAYITY